ncbi:MAG: MATE family efflux transporter [Candidatus Altiarchaeota archaeon]
MGKDLTEGSVLKTIVSVSLPMVVAFTLQSTFNIVDAYFVGKLSASALAAVSISFPIVFLIISLSTGLGVGSTSLIARIVGEKNLEKAGQVAEHAFLLAVALSIIFTFVGVISAGPLFDLMGVESDVRQLGMEYITIILFGSIVIFTVMVGNSIIQGEGEMHVPMIVMSLSAILNIILDPIFIFTLGMGVRGAAYATVLSRSVGLLIILLYFLSGKSWIRLAFPRFSFNMEYVKGIFYVGVPSSLSNVFMSIGMFLLTLIVSGFGTEALAAFGVVFRLDSLAILPGLGISVGIVTLVGQNVGAGRYDRAREMTMKAGLISSVFMSLLGVVFFVFSRDIMALFNSDPLVIAYGSSFLRIVTFSYLVVGFSMSISGAFLGSGHPIPSLLLTLLRVIILSVPLAYILSSYMGLSGVWYGILVSSIASSVVAIIVFQNHCCRMTRIVSAQQHTP